MDFSNKFNVSTSIGSVEVRMEEEQEQSSSFGLFSNKHKPVEENTQQASFGFGNNKQADHPQQVSLFGTKLPPSTPSTPRIDKNDPPLSPYEISQKYIDFRCPKHFNHQLTVGQTLGLQPEVFYEMQEEEGQSVVCLWDEVLYLQHFSCLYWIERYIENRIKTMNSKLGTFEQFMYLGFNKQKASLLVDWYKKRYYTNDRYADFTDFLNNKHRNQDLKIWITNWIRKEWKTISCKCKCICKNYQ